MGRRWAVGNYSDRERARLVVQSTEKRPSTLSVRPPLGAGATRNRCTGLCAAITALVSFYAVEYILIDELSRDGPLLSQFGCQKAPRVV